MNIWVVSSCLQHVKWSKKGTLYSTVQYIYSAIQEKKFPPYLCKGIFLPENPLKTTFNYLKVVRNYWFPTSFEWHLRPPRCLPWVRRTIYVSNHYIDCLDQQTQEREWLYIFLVSLVMAVVAFDVMATSWCSDWRPGGPGAVPRGNMVTALSTSSPDHSYSKSHPSPLFWLVVRWQEADYWGMRKMGWGGRGPWCPGRANRAWTCSSRVLFKVVSDIELFQSVWRWRQLYSESSLWRT